MNPKFFVVRLRTKLIARPVRPSGRRMNSSTVVIAALIWPMIAMLGCQKSDQTQTDQPSMNQHNASRESTTSAESGFSFSDVTDRSGVSFSYRNGEESQNFSILESLGGGIGVLDFDNDGAEDLLIPGGGSIDKTAQPHGVSSGLFRNRGEFKFDSVATAANVDGGRFYSHGTAVTDFDNDGFADCLITGYGGLQLLVNQGDGTFLEDSQSAQLLDNQWSSSAAWGDFNGDGSSDLYVAHYVDWSPQNHPFCKAPMPPQREICPPRQFNGLTDTVYFSNGDGTFCDVSVEVGLSPEGKGLGVVTADLDGDRDIDVYVTNDTVENFLYENDGGKFRDVSLFSGSSVSERGVPEGSMGVDAFDYNRDGRLDLWVVNYENESASLYENAGSLQYRHVSQRTGVTAAGGGLFVGWGTCPFDVDLDGFEDVFISNGHVIRYPVNAPVLQKPLLLKNQGGARFRNVAPQAGSYTTSDHPGRGSAVSDLNNDGLLDLIVSNNNQPVAMLENTTSSNGQWIKLALCGTSSSRSPIGTTVVMDCGRWRQIRHVKGGGSYATSNSALLHFGISAGDAITALHIQWPSGKTQLMKNPSINRINRIIENRESWSHGPD